MQNNAYKGIASLSFESVFYLYKFRDNDPDLFILVGVNTPKDLLASCETLVHFIDLLVLPFAFLAFTVVVLQALGKIQIFPSLKYKFTFCLFISIGMPFSAALLNQFNEMSKVNLKEKLRSEEKLRNLSNTFVYGLSEEASNLEDELKLALKNWGNTVDLDSPIFFESLSRFSSRYGLSKLFFAKTGQAPSEYYFSETTNCFLKSNSQKSILSDFFLTYIYALFKVFNFPQKEMKSNFRVIPELNLMIRNYTPITAKMMLGKLKGNFMQNSTFFFSDFDSDAPKSIIFATFDISKFRSNSLKIGCEKLYKLFPDKFFRLNILAGKGQKSPSNSDHPTFEEYRILRLSLLSKDSIVSRKLDLFGTERLLFTQYLPDYGSSIGISIQTSSSLFGEKNRFALLLFLLTPVLILARKVLNMLPEYIISPLLDFRQAVLGVENGDYRNFEMASARGEFIEAVKDLNTIISGLRQKKRMAGYVHSDLQKKSFGLAEPRRVEKKKSTILFAGIRNFTALEKNLSPEKAFEVMDNFLKICANSIKRHSGEIDKYIGDTAMAIFSDNLEKKKIASKQAVRAALLIAEELEKNNFSHSFGVGIASGISLAGSIGSMKRRLDFSVIGDSVNLAARLEKLAGRDNFPVILVSEQVRIDCNDFLGFSDLGLVEIKGKNKRVQVFTPNKNGHQRS
ncbi:MAG: adenylate/guanylate cyclase domain-containing protein [Candidatus Riflebacteria bacterium]|nr:adenylate/guanylate cyclase domain-containing protein [Candidatus Riflebacteria bacterium]